MQGSASQASPLALTMADAANARFYGKLERGLRPRSPSAIKRIRAAKSPQELQAIVGDTLMHGSPSTRRKIRKAAALKAASLNVVTLT